MKKMNNSSSEAFSIKLSKLAIFLVAAIAVAMCVTGPFLVKVIMAKASPFITGTPRYLMLLIGGYICAAILFAFLFLLYGLISRIEMGNVFVPENVKALSNLARIVFAATVITGIIGICCTLMLLIVTATASFIIPIICVVKNAFGKAVEMKDELDYTV